METTQNIPFEATHPGSLIKDELKFRGIAQKDFAHSIDMQPTMLNEIIKGKRAITAEIALILEKSLDIPAEYWMRFQSGYELDCARIKERNITKNALIEQWKVISEYVNVAYLKKKNLLNDSLSDCISTVKNLFNAPTIEDLIAQYSGFKLQYAMYRKSEKLQIDERNLFTWEKVAKNLASEINVKMYDFSNLELLKSELNLIFFENNNVLKKTENLLHSYGIKFLILEKMDKTPVDGITFWSGENPTIVVTLRKKNIDNFAFTILHELGHVVKHLENYKTILDIENIEEKSIIEQEADLFAQQSLIDSKIWDNIKNRLFSDEEINNCASDYKINAAILLGRKCWESNNYKVYTEINRKIQ
ncbi:MAG: addiction module antidote protein, HigA family [Cytophagales bacterium]|nr:MAG: addiction module antidote protein, HigA family [Cytophagales bacterium]